MKTYLKIAVLVLVGCQAQQSGYEIKGQLTGVPDSSLVLLSWDNKAIDSAWVFQEEFEMKGAVESPLNVFLTVKGTRDYYSFWLENTEMTFEANAGEFSEAKVSGSSMEALSQELRDSVREADGEIQQLTDLLMKGEMTEEERQKTFERYNELTTRRREITQQFVRENTNTLVAAHIINVYKTTWEKDLITELYGNMGEEVQQSSYGSSIGRFLELSIDPQIGESYVDFAQNDPDGSPQRLSDNRGKYTLLEFWASWCGPCRMTNPELVKDYERFKDSGFEIFGVSLDQNKGHWIKAIADDGLPWMNVSDLKGSGNEAGLIYQVNGIPDNVLIDENGTIIARGLRGAELTGKLEELLAESTN